jgi:predicted RNA-binding Zn-ribbon protein involved in translation (DUF1610 family)
MKYLKITDEQLTNIVRESYSMCDVIRKLGLKISGGSISHYTRRIRKSNIDTSHFLGKAHARNKPSCKKKNPSEILIKRVTGTRAKSKVLVRALIESGVKHECSKCGQLPEWLGNRLTLDVDHINEDWLDDRIENLRFLCPNCHSQFSRKLLGS